MAFNVVIEVRGAPGKKASAEARKVRNLLDASGFADVICSRVATLYCLHGRVSPDEIRRIAAEVLTDPVTETFSIESKPHDPSSCFADIWYKPGVTDPAAESVWKAIRDLNICTIDRTSCGKRYEFRVRAENAKENNLDADEKISRFINRNLLNPLVQQCRIVKA